MKKKRQFFYIATVMVAVALICGVMYLGGGCAAFFRTKEGIDGVAIDPAIIEEIKSKNIVNTIVSQLKTLKEITGQIVTLNTKAVADAAAASAATTTT